MTRTIKHLAIILWTLFLVQTVVAELQMVPTVYRFANRKYYNQQTELGVASVVSVGQLILLNHHFRPVASNRYIFSEGLDLDVIGQGEQLNYIQTKLFQKPLNYPNPFLESEGTILAYSLNKPADITLYIYDMLGNLFYSQSITAGLKGAQSGLNNLKLESSIWIENPLSVGVYFFILLSDDDVIGRGKMAVMPDPSSGTIIQ